MSIIIESPESEFSLLNVTKNVPCHKEIIVRPVIYSRTENKGNFKVTSVICIAHENCQFNRCRFKDIFNINKETCNLSSIKKVV